MEFIERFPRLQACLALPEAAKTRMNVNEVWQHCSATPNDCLPAGIPVQQKYLNVNVMTQKLNPLKAFRIKILTSLLLGIRAGNTF